MQVVHIVLCKHTEKRYNPRSYIKSANVEEILTTYIDMKNFRFGENIRHLVFDKEKRGIRCAHFRDMPTDMAYAIAYLLVAHSNKYWELAEIELNEDYMVQGYCNMFIHLKRRK